MTNSIMQFAKNRKIIDTIIEELEKLENTEIMIQRLKKIPASHPNALKILAEILIMSSRLYPKNTKKVIAEIFQKAFEENK